MKSKFFDSHIHLNQRSIVFEYASNDWVFNNISTNLDDFYIALEQSEKHHNVFVTAGIHPLEIENLVLPDVMEILDSEISRNPKIIAIGETGLDFYRGSKSDEDKQKRWLFAHFELAKKYDLPLVIHVRGAHEEMLDFLEGIVEWRGVIHCFEGTREIAQRYLNLNGNWMLSVSPLIFRDTSFFVDFIKDIPIERLLVETDSPYLSKNFEKVVDIIKVIAEEKGLEFEETKDILWGNFCRFFGLNFLSDE